MQANVIVYDRDMRKVAYLENAFDIGYETPINSLWTAQFSLPATDEKNNECKPLYHVELFDGNERIELFRIIPNTATRSADGQKVTYQCEHVLATLLDDVLFQFHTIGNTGVYTSDVLAYVLSKQSIQRWKLGSVDFTRQFEYNWENENLLAALFSVPKVFDQDYMWTFDTSLYPWSINLVEPLSDVQAYIRYGVNMQGITKTEDPTDLCTRLYCLGYGEGVNQLTISDVNGGSPYLDADTQAQYGVVSRIFVDRRFQSPETLKARCETLLEGLKHPRVTYTVSASELYSLTRDPIDKFRVGHKVRVKDSELGVDITARVVNVRKSNVLGAPGDVQLEIANKPQNIAGSIADIADRQRINEVYAQGATNFDSHDFADNCDPTHPAILRFWVPQETARINKVRLSYQSEAFRAYSRSIEAAPSTTSGPSSRETTASGGQTTSGPSSTSTTASGGQTTSGPSSTSTTASGGTPTSGPSTRETTANAGSSVPSTRTNHWTLSPPEFLPADFMNMAGDPPHVHSMFSVAHTHQIDIPPHTHEMDHFHIMGPHVHGMDHTHNIGPHVHGMDHTHQIGSHTHGMDHTHHISSHSHGIQYGIFQGPMPTVVTVKVDGNVVPSVSANEDDIDIVPYLAKDAEGKITRGAWHTVEVIPNNLGRIVANVNSQIFVQSRGGGDY